MRSTTRSILAALCALSWIIVACAGEAPKVPEAGADARPVVSDSAQNVWPDTSPPQDTWPHSADSYAGTPFGCTSDAECFGRRCCATPWGISLCAERCPP